jgi:hypothetical protein
VAEPENLIGLADKLKGPQFSTGVGLLRFAHSIDTGGAGIRTRRRKREGERGDIGRMLGDFLGRLLPD